jgi:FkbM family methyltransferase
MKIFYGAFSKFIDVTDKCFSMQKCNTIIIPSNDEARAYFFTDPYIGIVKKIIILSNDNSISEYPLGVTIKIQKVDASYHITTINDSDTKKKLEKIHANLKFNHGTLNDELTEQKMVVTYFTGNEKVLEIGSNTGRNSLVIASVLSNMNNFVTLESDPDIAKLLTENRNLNNFTFHIENSALSKRKLIQKDWTTKESDVLLDGHKWVNTITLDQLNAKYNITFDTLVLDCEGAFYYILIDMPEILKNINLIVMENDYFDLSHKEYIDEVMLKNGFDREYVEHGGFWPCYNNFFEVWKRK